MKSNIYRTGVPESAFLIVAGNSELHLYLGNVWRAYQPSILVEPMQILFIESVKVSRWRIASKTGSQGEHVQVAALHQVFCKTGERYSVCSSW